MKKVNLTLTIDATMTEVDGKPMASFPAGPFVYYDIGYDAAVKIQASFAQALGEHTARLLAMGQAHAAEMGKQDDPSKKSA